MTGVSHRNAATRAAAIKLALFTAVSLFVTSVLAIIMGHLGLGNTHTYKAIFASASSLASGDDVRVAGVSVGSVTGVEHYHRSMAEVTFKIDASVPLTTATHAEIRFLNLVGARYLALTEGKDAHATALPADAVIPLSHTQPALDLTMLFNGFKPLFVALNPKDVNELSMNIVQVLQGEGGTVQALLARTASLTTTLAGRDRLIGEVIANLQGTLTTVDQHHKQLDQLITGLHGWMTQLAKDHGEIGVSLTHIASLTKVLADLVSGVRAPVKADVAKLRELAHLLNEPSNTATIIDLLNKLPKMMKDQTRTGTYGSWYSYYVCGVGLHVKLPAALTALPVYNLIARQLTDLQMHSTAKRCAQ